MNLSNEAALEWNSTQNYEGPFSFGGIQEVIDMDTILQEENIGMLCLDRKLALNPLQDIDIAGIFLDQLIDSISGAFTPDFFEYHSEVIKRDQNDEKNEKAQALDALLSVEKRGCLVAELYATERNYLSLLTVLIDFYKSGLIQRKLLSEQAANQIFFCIPELVKFHTGFLQELEDTISDWDTEKTLIANLFLEKAGKLRNLYTLYIDNYSKSQKAIKKKEQEKEFVNFVKESSKHPDTKRHSLKDIFVLPVQRTTRYHLLLKDLLKATNEDHPDKPFLMDAWEAMSELANSVNEKKRQEEGETGLFEAFEAVKGCPPTLISHKRRSILTAEAFCSETKKSLRLDLCSDLLMFSLIEKRSTFYKGETITCKFIRWIDILEMQVSEIDQTDICFQIIPRPENINRVSNTTETSSLIKNLYELVANNFSVSFTNLKGRDVFFKALISVQKTYLESVGVMDS